MSTDNNSTKPRNLKSKNSCKFNVINNNKSLIYKPQFNKWSKKMKKKVHNSIHSSRLRTINKVNRNSKICYRAQQKERMLVLRGWCKCRSKVVVRCCRGCRVYLLVERVRVWGECKEVWRCRRPVRLRQGRMCGMRCRLVRRVSGRKYSRFRRAI